MDRKYVTKINKTSTFTSILTQSNFFLTFYTVKLIKTRNGCAEQHQKIDTCIPGPSLLVRSKTLTSRRSTSGVGNVGDSADRSASSISMGPVDVITVHNKQHLSSCCSTVSIIHSQIAAYQWFHFHVDWLPPLIFLLLSPLQCVYPLSLRMHQNFTYILHTCLHRTTHQSVHHKC